MLSVLNEHDSINFLTSRHPLTGSVLGPETPTRVVSRRVFTNEHVNQKHPVFFRHLIINTVNTKCYRLQIQKSLQGNINGGALTGGWFLLFYQILLIHFCPLSPSSNLWITEVPEAICVLSYLTGF